MFALLILTFFSELLLIFLIKGNFQKWREAFIKSVIILFTIVAVSTEILSFFYLLKTQIILSLWFLLNLCFSFYLFKNRKDFSALFFKELKVLKFWFSDLSLNTLWVFISAILLIIFLIAIIAPPNTFDVLSYHLPRVANWIQNGSVEFYPTHIERQLFNPPLSEYFLLHLQLLAGSDRFANLVQFFSFISCGVISSLITQRFGINKFGQLLTLFICVSLPMGILQASSSKNDIVVSLFIISFFYFLSKTFEQNNKSNFLFAGLSLGLALLTKGNAYFFCFPIFVLIFIKSIFVKRSILNNFSFISQIICIFLLALAINFGHFYRNWQLYNFPVKGEERLQNEKISFANFQSNVVRNYAVHLATPFESINEITFSAINNLLGEELNNPQSTVINQKFELNFSFHEDTAPNTLHLIFLCVAIIFVFVSKKGRENNEMVCLSIAIIFGFLLFCLFLKWNYWVSRVHLPLFFLGSSIISFLIVHKLFNKIIIVLSLFVLSVTITIFLGVPRNLFSEDLGSVFSRERSEQYFANQPDLLSPYKNAADFLKNKNVREIGLDFKIDYGRAMIPDWEYNHWILLKESFAQPPFIRHVNVRNISKTLNQESSLPEWIITNNDENVIGNAQFEEVWAEYPLRILHKSNP